ncbi:MAG: T9SS type A sorting domain-containing protein, partial [candidate division WOR-3 bacterium]|nr:T9SS type A sorting domain-containing protein [candidate division WOR-3 bacterium]
GVTWCQWNRPSEGLLPYAQLNRLRSNTLIWYSGNTGTSTIAAQDRDSLARYVQTGTNLFITGQNIAEELQSTPFLESICGCRFDSSGWSGFFAFGNRQDSLGAFVPGIATTGGNGAGNQTSRDVISPLGNSTGFLVYDSVTVRYAATRRQLPAAGGKVVFMGFGFEAANRPVTKPTYFNRMQLMDLVLTWFGVPTGIAERQPLTANRQPLAATIVRGRLILQSAICNLQSEFALLDASGRRVLQLRPGPNDVSRLPAGVYFVRSYGSDGSYRSYRLLLVR